MGDKTDTALLQAILDTAVDGIITIDTKGTIRTANRAAERIFGYQAVEIIGRNMSVLMPQPYRAEHDAYLERYNSTGERRIIGIGRDVRGLRKDGSTFPLHLGVSEVHAGGERIFTGIVQDITARRNLEEAREALIAQLEAANAELERFTYTVSHDLKSPLITIKGFLGLLEQDARSGNMERLVADIARIGGAADKMKQLLDELLDLSRIGRIANPQEDIDMNELAEGVLQMVAGSLSASSAKIEIQPGMPRVRGDKVRLGEVLQNLVENALKFMDGQTQPHIQIGFEHRDQRPVFYVRDNGMGIDPRYQDRVFRLFEQLDGSHEGSGIGLSLVKRIVEVHEGKIWVESEGLGKGSSFYVALPESAKPGGQLGAE